MLPTLEPTRLGGERAAYSPARSQGLYVSALVRTAEELLLYKYMRSINALKKKSLFLFPKSSLSLYSSSEKLPLSLSVLPRTAPVCPPNVRILGSKPAMARQNKQNRRAKRPSPMRLMYQSMKAFGKVSRGLFLAPIDQTCTNNWVFPLAVKGTRQR